MILARTLRRAFTLTGPLPAECIAYLHTDPRLPAPTTRTDTIEIEARTDGLFSMQCSWGQHLVGSARALENALERAIHALALSDEAPTPYLNASVVRLHGMRVLLVAEVGDFLDELTLALIVQGAAHEGVGLVFLRPGGVVAHPSKPRLTLRRLAATGMSSSDEMPGALTVCQDGSHCTIDPRIAGAEWSVTEGPVDFVVFVERNDKGRSAVVSLGLDQALGRSIRSMRTAGRPDVRAFLRLRASLENTRMFRLSMGAPITAAEIIQAHLPALAQLRVDGGKHFRQDRFV